MKARLSLVLGLAVILVLLGATPASAARGSNDASTLVNNGNDGSGASLGFATNDVALGAPAALRLMTGVSGQVRNASGTGLVGITAAPYAFSRLQNKWVRGTSALTNATGQYGLPLDAGTYRILFEDLTGAYVAQWFNNKPTLALADDVVVTKFGGPNNINATLVTAGHITGTVTDPSGGLSGIDVTAVRRINLTWTQVGATQTVAGGTYDLGGLPAGKCRVKFRDPSGAHITEWYDNKASVGVADDVTVSNGATTSGISATLDLIKPSVTSPNGGESWEIGSWQTITWTPGSGTGAAIAISRDGGTGWLDIATGLANTGTYSWTVVGPATTQGKIMVTTSAGSDASNGVFTIKVAGEVSKPGKPVAKSPKGLIASRTPTFKWTAATGATTYEVRIYKGTTLLKKKTGITKTSWKCTKRLPRRVWLSWKVRASNEAGAGPWSAKPRFKVR